MTEIDVARHSLMIDPHLHIWGWEIPVYLFLGGMAAGLMILTSLLGMRRDERSPAARWLAFAAPVLVSVGMGALFLDLAYKVHVLRFYLAFRWTSPMCWGAWILVLVYPVTLLLALGGLDDAQTERAAGLLGRFGAGGLVRSLRQLALRHLSWLRWANLAVGVGLGVYTGILLSTLGARALWSSTLLGPLFLVTGASTGAQPSCSSSGSLRRNATSQPAGTSSPSAWDVRGMRDVFELRRRVGMVAPLPVGLPMSIYDNVAFAPRCAGLRAKGGLDDIVERCLRQAALWDEVKDRLGSLGTKLSGGQQQRLTIARALSHQPEILCLDEFSIAIDSVTTMRIEDVLKELMREVTIILVTNLTQQARRLADRTMFLMAGDLVEIGRNEVVFSDRPARQQTYDYITGLFG